jgi:agmatine deiminase
VAAARAQPRPEGTDGHVDGVAQYVAPGRLLLEVPADPASPDHAQARANLAVLTAATDASGRSFDVATVDPGPEPEVSYVNHYLATGAVVVPTTGAAGDDAALAALAAVYPDRQVVGVPAATIAFGGGGPHCITQQVPAGVDLGPLGIDARSAP